MASNDAFQSALATNKKWSQQTSQSEPSLFPALASGQHPQILWIGCSDSRVPETTLLGLKPGDVFVHRNIANILHPNDLSSLSVIQYAVEHLGVKHVVLCGHTSCGGCAAAIGNAKLGTIDTWLMPLRKIRAENTKAWQGLDDKAKAAKLVEANVRKGVETLRENPDVIEGIHKSGLQVHGVVYDIGSGLVKDLEIKVEEEAEKSRVEAFLTKLTGH